MSEAPGVSFEENDRAGVVTLNRPERLNALTREMFEALTAKYRVWAPAPHIYGVVMQSAHPTVFSSGGDLKTLHEWSEQGARGAIREFYRAGYDTPNVHLFTIADFEGFCGVHDVRILDRVVLAGGQPVRLARNLLGALAVYRLDQAR